MEKVKYKVYIRPKFRCVREEREQMSAPGLLSEQIPPTLQTRVREVEDEVEKWPQPSITVTLDAYHHVKTSCLVNGHVDLARLVLNIEWRLDMAAGTLRRSNVEFVRDLALCANYAKYGGSADRLPEERALELAADEVLIGRA